MTEPWSPSEAELEQIFAGLRSYARVVLAVSGGVDSMALMHLAAQWVRSPKCDPPVLAVATVDHGLRQGSADDARHVVAVAGRLGLVAAVLTWSGEKPVQGLQERARDARYKLLEAQAASGAAGRCAVATAHTLDDQAETLLMRLARGSGPDGLRAMQPVRALGYGTGADLVRPLLKISREQLHGYLVANGLTWREDPSNDDPRFERVRLRSAAGGLRDAGLTPQMLALAASRQARAVEALERATDALQAAFLDVHGGMFASIDAVRLAAQPAEIRVRLMERVLAMFGGSTPPADLAQVEQLAELLARDGALQATLGGCEVRACREEIRVFRESGRATLDAVELNPGEATTWDNRFRIKVTGGERSVIVRALDPATRDDLRRRVRTRFLLPARAAATLPAVWAGEDLISVGGLPGDFFPSRGGEALPCVETRFLHPMFAEPP